MIELEHWPIERRKLREESVTGQEPDSTGEVTREPQEPVDDDYFYPGYGGYYDDDELPYDSYYYYAEW
jgi:hypothetical protein